jgi:uncharacterized DUF497 family protein
MIFEWNETKAQYNKQKHGISFEEAASVFDDPLSEIFDDPEHSNQEEQLVMIGMSHSNKLLAVSFTERPDATRITSARRTTKREQNDYGA